MGRTLREIADALNGGQAEAPFAPVPRRSPLLPPLALPGAGVGEPGASPASDFGENTSRRR